VFVHVVMIPCVSYFISTQDFYKALKLGEMIVCML